MPENIYHVSCSACVDHLLVVLAQRNDQFASRIAEDLAQKVFFHSYSTRICVHTLPNPSPIGREKLIKALRFQQLE